MAHYLTRAYERSSNYLQGVRADPANTMGIVRALRVQCEGLTRLRDDEKFWTELAQHLATDAPDLDARRQEMGPDDFFEAELRALMEDMEGDEAAARRLLDDLGAMVTEARSDPYAIADVRDVTRRLCEWVCAELGTLEQAVQGNKAQGNSVSWRSRFRALRVAVSATLFIAGGAVVVVDMHSVVLIAPAAGVDSIKAGLGVMMVSFKALQADLG